MAIDVRRTGEDSVLIWGDKIAVASVFTEEGQMRFSFRTPRGTGNSRYSLWPTGDSFAAIAKAMMQADADAAIKAFGAALSDGIPSAAESSKAA